MQHFLAVENQHPGNLAYDRPSPKLLAFLSKHYGIFKVAASAVAGEHLGETLLSYFGSLVFVAAGLRGYIPQNNNFVVYNVYWSLNPHKRSSRHGRVSEVPAIQ
eukprot:1160141-Pelagomonas_calceolata.AAC.6